MMKYLKFNNQNYGRNNRGFHDGISCIFFLLLLLNIPITSAGIGSVSGPSIQLDVVEYVIGVERRAKLADGTPVQEYDQVDLLENSTPPAKDGTQVNIKIDLSKDESLNVLYLRFSFPLTSGNFI